VATIKTVQREIAKFEGFAVVIKHGFNGRDVRDDKSCVPGYSGKYERIARNSFTVADWIRTRFESRYPGFKVTVLRANGKAADGRMKLESLRRQYVDES